MTFRAALVLTALFAASCTRSPPGRRAQVEGAPPAPHPEPSVRPVLEDPPPPAPPAPREVTFETEDGVTIAATLRPPRGTDEPLVILVHQLGSTRAEWAAVIERLDREPRIASLAIDLRGHGGSTMRRRGAPLDYHAFSRAEWAATEKDVRAAIRWASGPEGTVPERILAIGSSIGATAVIAAAAGEPMVRGVVAISPGRAYHGFDGITPALALSGRPLLAIVAAEDLDGVETARALGRIGGREPIEIASAEHGVALLAGEPLDQLETFVRTTLDR